MTQWAERHQPYGCAVICVAHTAPIHDVASLSIHQHAHNSLPPNGRVCPAQRGHNAVNGQRHCCPFTVPRLPLDRWSQDQPQAPSRRGEGCANSAGERSNSVPHGGWTPRCVGASFAAYRQRNRALRAQYEIRRSSRTTNRDRQAYVAVAVNVSEDQSDWDSGARKSCFSMPVHALGVGARSDGVPLQYCHSGSGRGDGAPIRMVDQTRLYHGATINVPSIPSSR